MRFTRILAKGKVQLNSDTWNRRVWEKGYIGPSLPRVSRTHPPPKIVEHEDVAFLRRNLEREWNVMQWLANPYINEEKERPFLERHGDILEQCTQRLVEAKQRKMPNKPKVYKQGTGELNKATANVGNLLHSHRTVEDQMKQVMLRNRWD